MTVQDQDFSNCHWRKSSLSAADGNCVEVGLILKTIVAVRDSKNPEGPVLVTSRANWHCFIDHAKSGAFDLG